MVRHDSIHSINTLIARGEVVKYEKAVSQKCQIAKKPSIALHDYALDHRPDQPVMLRFFELHEDLRGLASESKLRMDDLASYLVNLSTQIRRQCDIAHIADFLVIGAEASGGLPVGVLKKVEKITGTSHGGPYVDPIYPKY